MDIRDIEDGEVVSHYGTPGWPGWDPEDVPAGTHDGFRGLPRRDRDERGMSVQIGRLSPAEMVEVMMPWRSPRPHDAVRHASVRRLREAGFIVRHTPSRLQPNHATVEFPTDWTDDVTEAWHDCFSAPILYEDADG